MTFASAPRATLIATLTELPGSDGGAFASLPADWLEVRADLVGDPDLPALRRHFPGKFLYTLRSQGEGGGFAGPDEERHRRLRAAAEAGYDYIDLEADRDLDEDLLAAVPRDRRILSWHGPPTDAHELADIFERMAHTRALFYKLIPAARRHGQDLAPLRFLHGLEEADRRRVVCFAAGAVGTWTRLLSPRLGAPFVYGAVGEVPGAPGQPTVRRLRDDFGLPALPPVEALFGVVGNPIHHSLSPRIHNTAYQALGLPYFYVAFHAETFSDFWLDVVEDDLLSELGFPLQGLSVTPPYKAVALAVAGASSPRAEAIGAANTLVLNGGVWEAESTDPEGVVVPLQRRGIDPSGRPTAVVGCGGAGRAAAVGLAQAGAQVTLFNRGQERGERAARQLHLPFRPLDTLDPAAFSIVVHATSLGRDDEPPPFAVAALPEGAVVVDLVYRIAPTPLVAAARARGLTAIDGREVLLFQAVQQFRMMTGENLPIEDELAVLGLASQENPPAPS
jgi:3-dehydroquinate dehydratase / shikimate dehydrogenase